MRYEKDGKFHIKKGDLGRKVILIKNHKDAQELMNVQAGCLSGDNKVLPIPYDSFERYNRFRVKHGRKPLKEEQCMVIDVATMKQERAKEGFDNAQEFFKS